MKPHYAPYVWDEDPRCKKSDCIDCISIKKVFLAQDIKDKIEELKKGVCIEYPGCKDCSICTVIDEFFGVEEDKKQ